MDSILTIARREFKAYFITPIAYVYLVTFLVVTNWLFFRGFFLMGQADMRLFFGVMPWIFLFFVPAVSMGKWAEERKQGTLELLFTMPIRDSEIVAGKFLASLMLIATALFLTFPIPLTVAIAGDPDWGPIIGGYLGSLFLGGAYLSIGLAISSVTENQIIAFILGVTACFIMLVIGTPFVVGGSGGILSQTLEYLGLGSHFQSIARGIIDSRDITYYLSVTGFFMFINLQLLRTRARR